jgi:WD40 repeat protein
MPKHKVILEATIKAILDTSDGVQLQFHSPDGKHLATASEDGTVQVYALGIRELLKLARSRVTRRLHARRMQAALPVRDLPVLALNSAHFVIRLFAFCVRRWPVSLAPPTGVPLSAPVL